MSTLDYRGVQYRRVYDLKRQVPSGPRWVGVREELLHRGGGANGPERFGLRFLDAENVTLSPFEWQQRERLFRSQAAFLHDYQSFRILDLAAAESSYRLQFLGVGLRGNRPIFRVVVWSKQGDRPGWVLDLDQETGYPLYRGEYSRFGVLIGEVEVTDFAFGFDAHLPSGDTWAWKPVMGVQDYASTTAAIADLNAASPVNLPYVVPEQQTLPAGYRLHTTRVVTDPFSGEKRLVLVFTDGIDTMFLAQKASAQQNLVPGDAISLYSDGGMTECVFYHGGIEFLIIVRTSAERVRAFAEAVYLKAHSG